MYRRDKSPTSTGSEGVSYSSRRQNNQCRRNKAYSCVTHALGDHETQLPDTHHVISVAFSVAIDISEASNLSETPTVPGSENGIAVDKRPQVQALNHQYKCVGGGLDKGFEDGQVLVILWRSAHSVKMESSRRAAVQVHNLRILCV